jgi:thymidylate synthase
MEITAKNTNDLQFKAYEMIQEYGVHEDSRNGAVLRMPEPVLFKITEPLNFVNTCPVRDANPFFHVFESLAMLGSYNNVDFLGSIAGNMKTYTDDGVSYNAFYGERIRRTWGDQLRQVVETLKADPNSRQAVIQIWDARDLGSNTKDRACNLNMIFSIVNDKVRMTTTNRSNDAIWGIVSGANMVHLPFFLWYVCDALGMANESWFHFVNNLHVYTDNPKWDALTEAPEPHSIGRMEDRDFPLFFPHDEKIFDADLQVFLSLAHSQISSAIEDKYLSARRQSKSFKTPFLNCVARPMLNAYVVFLVTGVPPEGIISQIEDQDWQFVCRQWMEKRVSIRSAKEKALL